MTTRYDPALGAHVTVSSDGRVQSIRHSQAYVETGEAIPRVSAESYLRQFAGPLQIPASQLAHLERKVSFFNPQEAPPEFQIHDEKQSMDGTTVDFYQTFHNTPVWRRGVAVHIKQNPDRVIKSTRNIEEELEGKLPDQEVIDQFRRQFAELQVNRAQREALHRSGLPSAEPQGEEGDREAELVGMVRQALRRPQGKGRGERDEDSIFRRGAVTRLLNGRFFIYKYRPELRLGGKPQQDPVLREDPSEEQAEPPLPHLPPVDERIRPGIAYLVAEIIFEIDHVVWLVLLEVETRSILYIERMTCGVNGLVYRRDPINKTGDLTVTSNLNNAQLNPHRDDVFLNDLGAPSGGNQALTGTYVTVANVESPNIASPTRPAGSDFDYDVRSDNFSAVNAYYHQTELFRTIESMGFPRSTYFDGTTFPTRVDHRGLGGTGLDINAHWSPNGTGGTDHQCYGLGDVTDTANPLGRAVDPYVHWHEMGGHGTLGDHVGSGNLGFAHSHGDGLAAIQNDPESALRATADRFRYAPFRPSLTRRFDRAVGAGWAWGGVNDDGGYGSEEILATSHFRIYQSLGGDSDDLARRQHAARMTTYLILRTTGELTPGTNPSSDELWCEEMQAADLLNWTSEGLSGGAYNKVVRWAFEKQGSFQPAGAPSPVTTEGQPPAVDVYIDDGRGGEYPYQAVHWQNGSVWNRNASDNIFGHQNAIDGATNYAYARVRNRGTQASGPITVRAFHSLPGAGLVWPNDFVEMSPVGGVTVASLAGRSLEEVTAGPFSWEPNINAYGHDCLLIIATAAGDPSNIDNFSPTETIQEWRLVPHDNNIAQRNVSVVPGGGGPEAFIASLDGAFFMAGNNLNRRATMELRLNMPPALQERGWGIAFDGIGAGNKFTLRAGEKRKIVLRVKPGTSFGASAFSGTANSGIEIELLADGILIGGMSYHIDPELKQVSGGKKPKDHPCQGPGQDLLDCLQVSGGRKVKKVCVRKVSLDIELDGDCDC